MEKYIYYLVMIFSVCACTDGYVADGGLADGNHDCSVWEYMRRDRGNWDSLVVAVEHAGLEGLFDGSDPEYREITVFGPVNYSVMNLLFNSGGRYNCVRDIPVDACRRMVMSHVLPGKHLKESFGYEVKGTLEGGTVVGNLLGGKLRVYRIRTPYLDVPDIGPEGLGVHALGSGFMTKVASADIRCTNGVVHSLSNTYKWTEW
ncbi:fasciclin domain-containing protein [Culturomica sp.]|uniref:fasciclin domain-containing protein n=1 Tax=Culturomica sp. TaxID=1926652 RepID=UPI000E915E5D|nr:fasciclin domain-containing protein [Culturomica sp.]HBO27774.1 hypothetical protein [Culturomica sp.]